MAGRDSGRVKLSGCGGWRDNMPLWRICQSPVPLVVVLFVSLYGCATPPTVLTKPVEKKAAQGLIPSEYLCSSPASEAVDPNLAREIKAFLEEGGILAGDPGSGDLHMVLNGHVESCLRAFSQNQKSAFKVYLSRSGRYLPMMRRIFQERNLPQDLVYLALVESGFNSFAKSPAAAVGMWQFIEGTARRYGLKVDDWVDERRDPEKATRAAAKYLKDLFQQFGCWYLAAAGYNAGEHRVERVLGKKDSTTFWTLAQNGLLPQETCHYVPQFIAAALIARNPQKYGFDDVAYQRPLVYDVVKVPGGTDLRRVAQVLDLDYRDLKELNPELKGDLAPPAPQEYLLKIHRSKNRKTRILARVKRGS
jgi:membrane-bound lytic murein transglycosylase D